MVTAIDKNVFDAEVQGKCIVDFYTSGCPVCEKLSPVFEKVSGQSPGTRFFKVNLDDDISLAERFGFNHVPVLMLFDKGIPVKSSTGFMEEGKLAEFIEG